MASERALHISGIVFGSILTLGPVWGMLGMVVGMRHSFAILHQSGIKDPAVLSHSIGHLLFLEVAGFIVCPIGIALLIYCVISLNKLKRDAPPPLPG